jgi:hypothetical protein
MLLRIRIISAGSLRLFNVQLEDESGRGSRVPRLSIHANEVSIATKEPLSFPMEDILHKRQES